MGIQAGTRAQAEEAPRAAGIAAKTLQPYAQGSASPNGPQNSLYPPDAVDAALLRIAVAAGDLGITVPLSATQAIATDGQELLVTGGTVTLHVADGVLSATYAAS